MSSSSSLVVSISVHLGERPYKFFYSLFNDSKIILILMSRTRFRTRMVENFLAEIFFKKKSLSSRLNLTPILTSSPLQLHCSFVSTLMSIQIFCLVLVALYPLVIQICVQCLRSDSVNLDIITCADIFLEDKSHVYRWITQLSRD